MGGHTTGGFRGRVLFLARAPFISGAERALLTILRHLDRQAVTPHVVLGCDSPMVGLIRAMDIPVEVMAMPKRSPRSALAWWRSVRQLRGLIRQRQPDLLMANDVPSSQAMSVVGEALELPRVIYVVWTITARDAGWWARSGAEHLVFTTQWLIDQFGDASGTPLAGAGVTRIPSVVDWPALADPLAGAGEPWPVADEGRPVLGFAGQLIESKGVDLLIEGLSRVESASRPSVLIAGEDTQTGGAYRQHLERLAAERGVADRVSFLGFLDDVTRLHQAVDAVVCPSRAEPQGLVPLEAARFGRPALVSAVGGLREVVVDGETGLHVTPTADAWAKALGSLPDRATLTRWGEAARRRAIEAFSPAVQQAGLMRVWADAAARRAGRGSQ